MSGNKQHFLPRFLQKGFASNYVSRKKVQVWYFEKEKSPEERNTKDVGLEELFYSEPGIGSLDDLITKKEDHFARKIERLRRDKRVCSDDIQDVAEFIYTMAIRTEHAREHILSLSSSLISQARVNMTDPKYMTDLVREGARSDNPLFRQKVNEEIRKRLPGANRKHVRRLAKRVSRPIATRLRKDAPSIGKKEAEIGKLIRFDNLAEQVGKKTQNDVLMQIHSDKPERGDFVKELIKMNWRVECFSQGSLILGDVAVLQVNDDYSIDQPIFGDGKRAGVILPIGNSLLLFGSKKHRKEFPSIEKINRSSAELSLRFFISHKKSEQEMEYWRYLARRALQQDKKS